MKAKIMTVLFIIGNLATHGVEAQDEVQKEDEQAFEVAIEFYEAENYQEAERKFSEVMSLFPNSGLKPRAHFNLALTYCVLKDYDKAEATFLEILDQPYNETDDNSLMEPYTLYKHHACRNLAFIAIEKKNFALAEQYIEKFDKKFPYQHFCGNEWAAYDMFKSVMRAKVYAGTGRINKALDVLVPRVFTNALASNENLLMEMIAILESNFTQEQIRTELTKAIASLTIERKKKERVAFITLFGVKAEVEDSYFDPRMQNQSDTEYFEKIVKENMLFKKFL
jgi:tetratricopeptide (TPR) repeat protein